jgi:hypothetical protein
MLPCVRTAIGALLLAGCGTSPAASVVPAAGAPAAGPMPPEVWTGTSDAPSMRDPAVVELAPDQVILTGTSMSVVEYRTAADRIVPSAGVGYKLAFFQDGKPFHRSNDDPWDGVVHRWSSTGALYFYCTLALPSVKYDFTRPGAGEQNRRPYAFAPLAGSTRKTAGGFPLDWEIQNGGHPIYDDGRWGDDQAATAGVDVVEGGSEAVMVGETRVSADGVTANCLAARSMSGPTSASDAHTLLLCPGPLRGDGTWDIAHPYPSEAITPAFSLVEGTRVHRAAQNGKFYVFYSSGDCCGAPDNYGGDVAVCDDLHSACRKLTSGNDTHDLLPGTARGLYMIGRPYPVTSGGHLVDIVFNARNPIDFGDDVLRCRPGTPVDESFLLAFAAGGPGCQIGPSGPFCGNGICEAGEDCAADCGRCQELRFSVATSAPAYKVGDSISGTVTVESSASATAGYGVGLELEVSRDGKPGASMRGGPLYFPPGKTTVPVPVNPSSPPITAAAAGQFHVDLTARGGACTWTAAADFTVHP